MTTAEQLQEAIVKFYQNNSSRYYEVLTDYDDSTPEDALINWDELGYALDEGYDDGTRGISTSVGLVELAENHGGGEGDGEERFLVLKLTNHDLTVQYFRIDGYYLSFDGSNWDGELREVKAVTRPVTFFE